MGASCLLTRTYRTALFPKNIMSGQILLSITRRLPMFTRRDWLRTAAATPVALSLPTLNAAPSADDLKAVVDKAVKYRAATQRDEGNFSANPRAGDPGLTALIAASLVRNAVPANNTVVAKALKYLETKVKKDGGVYEQGLSNYMTSLAIVAFKETNADGKYDKVIDASTRYVKSLQYDEGLTEKDPKFGGAGYDKPTAKGRPDLSNTQFMVDALLAAGVSKDDPTIKKALIFISRSQNLKSEFNDQPFAGKSTDEDEGGFVYNLFDQENAKSPKRTAEGGLRSEGGMTY